VQAAPKPAQAADMVLVRLAYAADLPTPDEALRALKDAPNGAPSSPPPRGGGGAPSSQGALAVATRTADPVPSAAPRASAETAPALRLDTLQDAIALAETKRDISLKIALERLVRLVHFEDGRMEFQPAPGAPPGLANDIQKKLSAWTNRRWAAVISSQEGSPTLHEVAEEAREQQLRGVAAHPHVRAVMDRFPGAQIIGVRSSAPVPDISADEPPLEDEE
jgi:DNA polymerase-3 subunit gamma/tau